MSVTHDNFGIQSDLARTKTEMKSSQLQQEKEWVDTMVEAQRTEDRFNQQKREELRSDLRMTYAEQLNDRKEQIQVSIKNFWRRSNAQHRCQTTLTATDQRSKTN